MNVKSLVAFACLLTAVLSSFAVQAQERPESRPIEAQDKNSPQIFSGPQVGEAIPTFAVRGVFDQWAGKELDFVRDASGKPIVLIFVHDVNRQSIAFTRILSHYTLGRLKDGVRTGIVWLADDMSEAESSLKRMRHALSIPDRSELANDQTKPTDGATSEQQKAGSPERTGSSETAKNQSSSDRRMAEILGVSPDGREGPGSYGLNRNVTLTVVIGNENKVTANYALIQPSLQVDMPKVLASVVEIAGGQVPKLEQLEGMPAMNRSEADAGTVPNLRPLLAPLIRKNASDQQVDEAAKAIQQQADRDSATRREVARIANTIIDAGKLENYGTARAQEYLNKWAKEFKQ